MFDVDFRARDIKDGRIAPAVIFVSWPVGGWITHVRVGIGVQRHREGHVIVAQDVGEGIIDNKQS